MRSYWKFLARGAVAFSPSIGLILARCAGLTKSSNGGLETVAAILQGFVLFPFIVWMWIDFRRHPEKYPPPGWLLRSIDVVLAGVIVITIVLLYFERQH